MVCPSCGAASEPGAAVCFHCRAVLTALTRGSVLGGRYEIVRVLGRGGMGAVYEARDRMLDETVALKVLRPELAGDEELVRRFRSEIRLARKVAHPNVARIYEYGEGEGLRWISMELVEGVTLKQHVQARGPLPAGEAIDLVAQTARGLQAIHAAGIVHRDLKTANLMLDARGTVRVMDFGIAKASEGSTGGYTVGTPEYMSPEQARGRPVDERSDLYSLGIVAFELLTGDVPFRGDSPVATLMMHAEREPPLRGAEAAVPAALVPALERALAKEPAQRFDTAADFLAAWPSADATPVRDTIVVPPRRRRSRWALWSAAAAVAVGAAVALLAGRSRGTAPPDGTPAPLVAPTTMAATAPPSAFATPVLPPVPTPTPAPIGPSPGARASAAAAPPTPLQPTPAPTEPAPSTLPSPAATPEPAPVATPATPPPSPSPAAGALFVSARPWAWVTVDGRNIGETPFRALPLDPGPHEVLLRYPGYRPFKRKVTIRAGETFTLRHDWTTEGVRE